MLRPRAFVFLAGVALALSQLPQDAAAQGKGSGKEKGEKTGQEKVKGPKDGGSGKVKGNSKSKGVASGRSDKQITQQRGRSYEARAARAVDKGNRKVYTSNDNGKGKGARNKFVRATSFSSMPQSVRRFATSRRANDVILATAVSHAYARGRGDNFVIDQVGNRMRIKNRKGEQLVFIDDENARNMGRWDVDVLDDNPREGGPSFCRSGAGHPVWGRQWCVDKGFGIGSYEDYRWGRTSNIGNIVFAPEGYGTTRLIGDALAGVLGNSAFNRLALHAVTLGLVEPLIGRWVAQPTGPQLLMVNSGALPVAEFVDVNRDYRADNMIVALRPWL